MEKKDLLNHWESDVYGQCRAIDMNDWQATRFVSLISLLAKFFDQSDTEEATNLRSDPLSYVSNKYVFRCLSSAQYADAQQSGFLEPRSGDIAGGQGVYLSNCPRASVQYGGEVFLVIPRSGLVLTDYRHTLGSDIPSHIVEGTSKEFLLLTEAYMANHAGEQSLRYKSINAADLSYLPKAFRSPRERNIVLRQPQPLDLAQVTYVWSGFEFQPQTIFKKDRS